jgi:hypothetical protein
MDEQAQVDVAVQGDASEGEDENDDFIDLSSDLDE